MPHSTREHTLFWEKPTLVSKLPRNVFWRKVDSKYSHGWMVLCWITQKTKRFMMIYAIILTWFLIGLKMASRGGFKKVWLGSDSLNIINYLNKKSPPSWIINHLMHECFEMKTKFEAIKSHMFWGRVIDHLTT